MVHRAAAKTKSAAGENWSENSSLNVKHREKKVKSRVFIAMENYDKNQAGKWKFVGIFFQRV